MICYAFPEASYIFFSTDIPPLLYYSHIPTAIITILIGLFVFLNGRQMLLNRLLFIICTCFSLWLFANLILWTNTHSDLLIFSWSFLRVLSSLISIFCIYFIYVFLYKKDLPTTYKGIFLALLAPTLILAPSYLNLNGFDITNCDAYMYEGLPLKIYHATFGVLAMIWILALLILNYRKANAEFKKQILLMGAGIEFFLFSFFAVIFLVGYMTTLGILHDSRLEMYGLFGMTVFMTFIAILIVRFKAFNITMISSEALVIALFILTGSLLLVVDTVYEQVIAGITLFLSMLFGIYLIRSVKKEILQREQIAELAENLKQANDRLKILDKMKSEFVSIASHQLRSPLTSIRGYTSMLIEGSYGKLPAKITEVIENIGDSAKYMALSVEDYLNVSRIEAGNMKYELCNFDLKDTVSKVVDEQRSTAIKKGLILVFRSDLHEACIIYADIGKTRQIIMNIIDNAIKYTPKGTITVVMQRLEKNVCVTIQDTGVGMNPDTQNEVFEKFVRAKNANSINVTGTGLGLYVARKMLSDMGGSIRVESEGEGKGSSFLIEFPLV